MPQSFRYFRPTERLEFYTLSERQSGPPPADAQPPFSRDFFVIKLDEPLDLEAGQPDLRRFPVNTPEGDTVGTIVGLLADAANSVIPYAYVQLAGNRVVVVPTNQLMVYADACLTTLEGGIAVLSGAPEAQFDPRDAQAADRYWIDYRRRNAA